MILITTKRKTIIKLNIKMGQNYRRISRLNTVYKIYAEVLNERVKKDIKEKNILRETPSSLRKNKLTIDNVYLLQHVIDREQQNLNGKYSLYCTPQSDISYNSKNDTVENKRKKLGQHKPDRNNKGNIRKDCKYC